MPVALRTIHGRSSRAPVIYGRDRAHLVRRPCVATIGISRRNRQHRGKEPSVEHAICVTCGTQYPPRDAPPTHCPICEDDRQYIGPDGQQWTTLAALRGDHRNTFTELAPGI